MLILAGVSLNAIIGDNGVISNAQKATMLNGIAALEEYLQQKYTELYEYADNFNTPKELVEYYYPAWFYQSSQGYIPDSYGHAMYLLNTTKIKEDVPELRDALRGGNASKAADYYGQKDVYGVTSDLQVYYCEDGSDTILGVTLDDLDKDNPFVEAYAAGSDMAKLLTGSDDKALSNQQLKSVTSLTLNDSTTAENILKEAKNLPNLKTITLSGITISSLSDLKYCTKLEVLNIQKCTIGSYSGIGDTKSLVSIYLIDQTNEQSQQFLNDMITAEMSNLEYLGIYRNSTTNYLTDISTLGSWNSNTLKNIKYLYFYNNQLTSISAVSGCTNLEYLSVYSNTTLTGLEGIENLINLRTLYAYSCGLTGLPTFASGSKLEYISIYSNSGITTLSGLANCAKLATIYAYSCKLSDITAMSNKTFLNYVHFGSNGTNLVSVGSLKDDTSIRELYLAGNSELSVNDVKNLSSRFADCGKNYSIDSTFIQYLTSLKSYDLRNRGLTDYSDLITNLKNGTQIYRLGLDGNTGLAKSKLALLIKQGVLDIDELDTILSNLTLSTEQIRYINTLKGYTLTEIQALTDAQINSMEPNNSDIYFRYLLSTLTGMQYLSLVGIDGLTSFDWVNHVTGLLGLDLYGTKISDLSLANTKCPSLVDLRINYPETNLSNIQGVISRLVGGRFGGSGDQGFSNIGYGFTPVGNDLLDKLSNCAEVTYLYMWEHSSLSAANYTLDLTNCTNLKQLKVCRCISGKIILNAQLELTTLEDVGFYKIDFSNASSLKNLIMSATNFNEEDLNDLSLDLASFDTIERIEIGIYTGGDCNAKSWIDNFKNCTNLKELDISRYRHYWEGIYGDMSSITLPSSLEVLNFSNNGITVMPNMDKCTKLRILHIEKNKLIDLDFCDIFSNLEELYANDNKLVSIYGIKDLKKLKIVNIENNLLNDYSYKESENGSTLGTNNLVIFGQNAGLEELYLKGNNFDDITPLENLTIPEDKRSGF